MNSMNEEKLEKFKEEIARQAMLEEAAIMSKIDEMTKADYDKTQDSVLDEAYRLIQHEIHEIEQESASQYAIRRLDLRRHLANERQMLEDEIFDAVRSRLEDFAKSPQYREFLIKQIEGAAEKRGGDDFVIKISERDKACIEPLQKRFAGKKIETDSAISLGGSVISCAEKGYVIDLRLEELLGEQRREFHSSKTLPLEV